MDGNTVYRLIGRCPFCDEQGVLVSAGDDVLCAECDRIVTEEWALAKANAELKGGD